MSLIDLSSVDQQLTEIESDICIVGAGAAGLYLARRLREGGLDVTVLEAGPRVCVDAAQIDFEPQFRSESYRGASEGRAFGFGGTTSRWGGQLSLHRRQDLRAPVDPSASAWQHIVATVEQRYRSVATRLGVRVDLESPVRSEAQDRRFLAAVEASGLECAASSWLPFRRRHLGYLIDDMPAGTGRGQTYLGAVAAGWTVVPDIRNDGRIVALEAKAITKRRLRVKAKSYVIAAGAIESARILLELDRANANRLLSEHRAVGRYLSDHLSCRIAEVASGERRAVATAFGPRFEKGMRRTFRFIESDIPSGQPRYFVHFIFGLEHPGFRVARACLQGLQARRFPDVSFAEGISGISGLMSLAFARFARSRLHIPDGTPAFLHLDMEQWPDRENAVSLGVERDQYDRPRAIVRWAVTTRDRESLARTRSRVVSVWSDAGHLPRLLEVDERFEEAQPHDAFHPVGTCRLGDDPEAVVGRDLRVHGTQNLFVLSTGILPSAGTAGPTLTMLCFAEALAEKLLQQPPDSPSLYP